MRVPCMLMGVLGLLLLHPMMCMLCRRLHMSSVLCAVHAEVVNLVQLTQQARGHVC